MHIQANAMFIRVCASTGDPFQHGRWSGLDDSVYDKMLPVDLALDTEDGTIMYASIHMKHIEKTVGDVCKE
jgi:hypothetical protein